MRLKILPALIRKGGFTYFLEIRDEKRCIYRQQSGNRIVAFEVFRTKLIPPHHHSENDCANFDKVESFPGNEEFGKRAWYCPDLKSAMKKYEECKN